MIRMSQLADIPLSMNSYSLDCESISSISSSSYSFIKPENNRNNTKDNRVKATRQKLPYIKTKRVMDINTSRDFSLRANSSKRLYIWSFFKGIIGKCRWLSFSGLEPRYSPDNGPFQPYAERAICLNSYGDIGKCLGQGISSHVYLLRNTVHNEPLAVKVFKSCKKKIKRTEYMKSIINEFSISYTSQHENIICTYDFVKFDHDYDRFAMIMDYCPQGDLYSLIYKRELEQDEIYAFLKQLLNGLKCLHDNGVAHRDLKPENLLLNGGTLKISDFGSADVFRGENDTRNKMSRGLVGTAPYIAPELFATRRYWGTVADVWSVGIIFHVMYFSRAPFASARKQDSNYCRYLQKRDLKKYSPFKRMPSHARELLYLLLNPNYEERITVDSILANPWLKSISPNIEKCKHNKKHRLN